MSLVSVAQLELYSTCYLSYKRNMQLFGIFNSFRNFDVYIIILCPCKTFWIFDEIVMLSFINSNYWFKIEISLTLYICIYSQIGLNLFNLKNVLGKGCNKIPYCSYATIKVRRITFMVAYEQCGIFIIKGLSIGSSEHWLLIAVIYSACFPNYHARI